MRRPPFVALVVSAAALLSLCLPAVASAGTYTWAQPGNFTAVAPGANPDHDPYGGTPWSYLGTSGTTTTPLAPFSTNVDGGLSGWGGGSSGEPLVGINSSGSAIVNGTATYPAGGLVVQPGATGQSATVAWTSPLTGIIHISGAFTPDDTGTPVICPYSTDWVLTQSGGGVIASGSLATALPGPGTFDQSVNVTQGQSISASVANGVLGRPACDATGLSFHITAAATAPRVSLTSPGDGALLSSGRPKFSGSADQSFGASSTVTVRIYGGNSPGGTPVQTLAGTRSGASFSAAPGSPLPDGTYTAQAEQDDLASPVDAGLSAPVHFTIHTTAPRLHLDSPGTKPLRSSTPTFTGLAGTAPGDAKLIGLAIYPGGGTTQTPVRFLPARVDPRGRFSVKVATPLDDGRYTAQAVQAGAGSSGFSQPVTFRIKVHAPAVTLAQPASGTTTTRSHPRFSGRAGNRLGDSPLVTVELYSGAGTGGRRVGSMRVSRTGSSWSGEFPFALAPGRYTARATQTDDAGHSSHTPPRTFQVVVAPAVIGSAIRLSRQGVLAVPITCIGAIGQVCSFDVLSVTVPSLQAVPGGPIGHLRLLFAYVSFRAGHTFVVKATVPADVLRAVRRAARLSVQITVTFSLAGGPTKTVSAVRPVPAAG